MKKNPVVHFEMPAKDKERVVKFYKETFGWGMQQMGPEMGNYILATTTETDKKGMVKKPGAINGGFFEYNPKNPALQYPSFVISVDDIKDAMKKVKKTGGKVLGGQKPGKPDDIPGVGLYVSFLDTEGNRVGMLQPSM
ncbi:glyoxalase [Candidatus Roizmanbacteria bacterium RIFCSPLOWO2_01_FULL_38_12]|uniref:Glyoxalase n=1 Tax=Candidatus Roizmanbacteria bacterium RIFCSPLOWO2_01_FULL_38_12 TaxID=1802061 RepID=A0A1F7IR11_9BACT|nr:MAG: glyoxalase [Candidatus Roizmanbacteria bacterium RIFCSPHIGHO2_01_FULL_38_15]OGK34658.1 MAG: glyoxalase [Candidatus Roizmanbacteria bacterium RIFCSPHIGHO2_12_FULL_38_13]OGK45797.1 MAG: glyoxalase [Candidatus Roizmanbacteria bacterium RIFCSPLOWO2_01_FULL_38_12]